MEKFLDSFRAKASLVEGKTGEADGHGEKGVELGIKRALENPANNNSFVNPDDELPSRNLENIDNRKTISPELLVLVALELNTEQGLARKPQLCEP
jgi:hypothetical protein